MPKQTISWWYLIGLYFVLLVCVRLFASAVAVKHGPPPHPPTAKVTCQHQRKNLTSCYKAAHCEWFNIWAATSATCRAAWLWEEAKTLVACGQRRPFRRRDAIKKFALFSAQVCKSFQCADWFWKQCNNTIFITDEHKQQCSALNHFLIFCWNLESGAVTGRTWMNLFQEKGLDSPDWEPFFWGGGAGGQTVKRFNPHPFAELAAIFIVL